MTVGRGLPARKAEHEEPVSGSSDGTVNMIKVPAATRAGKLADIVTVIMVFES